MTSRHSPLEAEHRALGAKLVPFGGWDMPLAYPTGTLAEHRASDPKMVAPVFSPNSQRVYFSSDQHGKPAIYTMSVERLVEETEG